jgi:hypothetical protein
MVIREGPLRLNPDGNEEDTRSKLGGGKKNVVLENAIKQCYIARIFPTGYGGRRLRSVMLEMSRLPIFHLRK